MTLFKTIASKSEELEELTIPKDEQGSFKTIGNGYRKTVSFKTINVHSIQVISDHPSKEQKSDNRVNDRVTQHEAERLLSRPLVR